MIASERKPDALDPWLAELARLAGTQPQTQDLPLDDARELVNARFCAGPTAARVHKVLDAQIPGPAGNLPARIYFPAGSSPAPVTLYFHGGGFVLMGLQTHDGICRQLCDISGSCVVSIAYRLAPECPFPAATDDAMAALHWAAREAQVLGVDPTRLAVAGDSAGGNLATVTALRSRDQAGPALRAQLLFYPVVDCTGPEAAWPSWAHFATGYGLGADTMRWFRDQYLPQREDWMHPYASPVRAQALHALPPAHIVTAGYDILRDEGEAYAAALAAAGVATTLTRYPSLNHGFLHWTDRVAPAMQALRQAGLWLRAALHETPPCASACATVR